uniref:mRNA decay activator protein ZFP36 n=1 Tax=Monopterus albus TaxID=43700 RepID=A0A3Q3KJK5_MONAL|nr:zinc finger CCCH domain-containing protein 39-like [Monopterus albus]
MLQTSSDDLFLPSYQDEALMDNLLFSEESGNSSGGGLSLAKALLPLVEPSSPDLAPWVCSTRYKTELCTSYSATGFCKYAERCQFAHGLHELHVPYRHPKYKTELCRSYHTTGYCYYGSRCLFVHSPSEQRPALRRRRNVPCRAFGSFGVCPFGTRCNFLHVEREDVWGSEESPDVGEKTRSAANPPPKPETTEWMCRSFRSFGVCPYGNRCNFLHINGEDVSGGVDCPDTGKKARSVANPQLRPQIKDWNPQRALCRTFNAFGFCLYGTRCRFQHNLPSKIKTCDQTQGGFFYPQLSLGNLALQSPTSPFASTSPNSSTSSSPLATPPAETMAHNAFSSQHLSDLLLPLALHLQQMESSKAQEIWDRRAL